MKHQKTFNLSRFDFENYFFICPLDEMEWRGGDDEDGKKKKKKKKRSRSELKDDLVDEMATKKVNEKEHAAETEATVRKRTQSSEGTEMESMTDVKTSQKKADKKRRRSHSSELSGGEGKVEKPAKMRKVDEEASEMKGKKTQSLNGGRSNLVGGSHDRLK